MIRLFCWGLVPAGRRALLCFLRFLPNI
jgi:hypothetical protein